MDTSAWLERAIERMCEKSLESPPFELRELFTGDEWNSLSRGERTAFGSIFAKEVRSGNIEGIKFAPISKNGRHNKYIVF